MRRYADMPLSVVQIILDIFETFFILRFILLLFGANRESGLVRFIYAATRPFVAPFENILAPTVIDGWTVDWATVFAIVAYAFLAAVIMRLLFVLLEPLRNHSTPSSL